MTAPALTITMTDLESMADPDLYDMTTVCENRTSCLFLMMMTGLRVKKQLRWTKGQHIRMPVGSQWKFDYAIEFHKNSTSGDYQKLGNATDANKMFKD